MELANPGKNELKDVVSHYWVATYPYFETTLFVTSAAGMPRSATRIFLYDSDGAEVNRASIEFASGQVGILELDQFLGRCKLESGLKHAHLEVISGPGSRHQCRVHNAQGACLLGEGLQIDLEQSGFFPVLLGEGRSSMVAFVNHRHEEASVRCRLYVGKRSPETDILLPPMGTRIFDLCAEFGNVSAQGGPRVMPGYARVSTLASNEVGAHLIESVQTEQERRLFTSVS